MLSHNQYEELVRYSDERPHCMFKAPSHSLTRDCLLVREPNSGYGVDSAFKITPAGSSALTSYREKWGIKVVAMREP